LNIGERIKKIREAENLSQRSLAEKINVAGGTVAQFETGVRNVKDIHIAAICHEFNINENWLRTGEGEMFNAYNSIVDEINAEIGLDEDDKAIIRAYISLPRDTRKAIKGLMRAFITETKESYE